MIRVLVLVVMVVMVVVAAPRLANAAGTQQITRTAFFAVEGREVLGIAVAETYPRKTAPNINTYIVQPIYSVEEHESTISIIVDGQPLYAGGQLLWEKANIGKFINYVYAENTQKRSIFTIERAAKSNYEVLTVKRRYSFPDDASVMFETFIAVRVMNEHNPQKLIVLDPGHGGNDDRGTTGNNIYEKDINLDIALMTKDYLEKRHQAVYMTRKSDVDLDLGPRSEAANLLGADVFVSVHNNAFDVKAMTEKAAKMYKGTTVLYNSMAAQPAKDLAIAMNDNLVNALHTHEYPAQDRPGLSVLNSTWMPAVLAEVSMFPNNGDAKMISDRVNRQKAAMVLADTIADYLLQPKLTMFLPKNTQVLVNNTSRASNAANHNRAVYDGEWIYYLEAAGDTYGGSDSRIYRVRSDGSGQVKGDTFIEPFCNDSAAGLSLYNGYLYYENWSDNQKIYRISLDGTKKELVANVPARWLQINGNWMVYAKSELVTGSLQDNNLFKRNLLSGVETQIAVGGVENVCVDDGYVYYLNASDGYRIYRVALAGGSPRRLSDNRAVFFVVSDGKVYFTNYDDGGKLYSLAVDSGVVRKISERACGYLSVDDDYLYYTDITTAGLWKIKLNGTEIKLITHIFGGPITQVGDLIYYRSLFIKK